MASHVAVLWQVWPLKFFENTAFFLFVCLPHRVSPIKEKPGDHTILFSNTHIPATALAATLQLHFLPQNQNFQGRLTHRGGRIPN